MAISPVSSVSFRNNYGQVNFEGRKEKSEYHSSSFTNTLRSIPLATIIAMSPMVDTYAQGNVTFPDSNLKKELYSEINDNDTKIAKAFLMASEINWSEPHGMTVLTAYDSDGDASDYEKLVIEIKPTRNGGSSSKMYVRGLTIMTTYNKDTGKTTKDYIIEGIRTKSIKKADGTVVEKRQPGVSKKVSKEVFDTIRDRLGDSIKVKTKNITTDNDTEAENEIIFGM